MDWVLSATPDDRDVKILQFGQLLLLLTCQPTGHHVYNEGVGHQMMKTFMISPDPPMGDK